MRLCFLFGISFVLTSERQRFLRIKSGLSISVHFFKNIGGVYTVDDLRINFPALLRVVNGFQNIGISFGIFFLRHINKTSIGISSTQTRDIIVCLRNNQHRIVPGQRFIAFSAQFAYSTQIVENPGFCLNATIGQSTRNLIGFFHVKLPFIGVGFFKKLSHLLIIIIEIFLFSGSKFIFQCFEFVDDGQFQISGIFVLRPHIQHYHGYLIGIADIVKGFQCFVVIVQRQWAIARITGIGSQQVVDNSCFVIIFRSFGQRNCHGE